jgi:farnesyl diphosphate synthase
MDTRVTHSATEMPGQAPDLRAWSQARLVLVEDALERWVTDDPPEGLDHGAPAELVRAMRYAVLDGGKRLRPLLVLAACESLQGHADAALRAACAVELIHAYSLVHDDMPCMDNDILRRGKPTVHVAFGEATALLVGDALQALAFELLTPELDDADAVPVAMQSLFCRLLARAAGSAGMAGGQAIDLASVGGTLTEKQLRDMHSLKTGALLKGSVLMGAACGQASRPQWLALQEFGDALGLAFQVVDDILDVVGDSVTLGKTAGKDAAHNKPTYVSVMGLDKSRVYAKELLSQAHAALDRAALPHDQMLRALAAMVVHRSN